MNDTYRSGRTVVDGRTFQIEFWEDAFECRHVCVSEIVIEQVRNRITGKIFDRETEKVIDSNWMFSDRLDWAMNKICEYLETERKNAREDARIKRFCDGEEVSSCGLIFT